MKNLIKQLKYIRLKPEEKFLIDIISDLNKFNIYKQNNIMFYEKDNIILFAHFDKSNYFYVNHYKIWAYYKKNNFNFNEICKIIEPIIEKYFNLECKIFF